MGLPGGPVWVWFLSPQPSPGRTPSVDVTVVSLVVVEVPVVEVAVVDVPVVDVPVVDVPVVEVPVVVPVLVVPVVVLLALELVVVVLLAEVEVVVGSFLCLPANGAAPPTMTNTMTMAKAITPAMPTWASVRRFRLSRMKASLPNWCGGEHGDRSLRAAASRQPAHQPFLRRRALYLFLTICGRNSCGIRMANWNYDAADRPTSTTDTGASSTSTLTYDAASELTGLQKIVVGGTNQNLTLAYNAMGDRTQQTDVISVVIS